MRRLRWFGLSPSLSWALYDFANSAFATTVIAGFFPVFLEKYWALHADRQTAFAWLGWVNGGLALLIALLAPLLGAYADQVHHRKAVVGVFCVLGAVATAALASVGRGNVWLALLIYSLAGLGFSAGNIFYNALLPSVTSPNSYDRVSAWGYALGYLGGGLLFAVNVAMVIRPGWFGLSDASAAIRISFLLVGIWWLAFSLPLFLVVRESGWPVRQRSGPANPVLRSARSLWKTARQMRKQPQILWFLVAYWCYIDGVNSVYRMAVGYGLAIGLPTAALLGALLLTQFVAFPAAIIYGRFGERIGTRWAILFGIGIYLIVVVAASGITRSWQFFALAIAVGMVQGGVQSLSRSLYARLIPPQKSAQYFSFYGFIGRFSAVLGPLLIAITESLTGNARWAIATVAILFAFGGIGLWRMPTRIGFRDENLERPT